MTLASCGKEEIKPAEPETPGVIKVRFGAEAPITKAVATNDDSNFESTWVDGDDAIGVTVFSNGNSLENNAYAIWDGEAFEVDLKESYDSETSYQFKGVYPYSENGTVDFGATREQTLGNQNGMYDIMVSSTISSVLPAENKLVLPMERQTATVYFHLTSELDEVVKSATLITEDGKWIAASSATLNHNGFSATGDEKQIKLNILEDGANKMSTSDMKFWFNVLPVSETSLTLLVETETHSFTMSKKSKNTDWKAGHLYSTVINDIPAEKWAEIERPAGEKTEKITMVSNNTSEYKSESNNITATFAKAGAGNAPAWNAGESAVRVYAKGTLTVSSEYTITKIVYEAKLNGGGKNNDNYPTPTTDKESFDANTWTWEGAANSVVLTPDGTAGNIAVSSITVSYVDPNAGTDPIYKYSVMVDKNVTNGTVTVDKTSAKEGDEVTITATPSDGYELVVGSVKAYNAVSGAELTVTNNKFTMPAANVNVTAEFSERTKYSINLSQTTGGTISSDLARAWEGQTVTLSKELTSGYEFKAWDVKYGSENTPITVADDKFTMPAAAVTASATFIPTLTVSPMAPNKKESPAGSWDFTVVTVATDWEVSVPNDQDWATVEKTSKGFTLTYTANENDTESTEDRSVVITVSSAQAEMTGENAITITFSQSGKEYIAPGTGYNLVTDASDLSAGMVVVLGCADKSKVAGALGENKFLSDQDANFSEGILTSNNAIEFTLGGSSTAWTLTSEEGQLGATAAKAMSADPSASNYVGTWTISIDVNGNASITSTTSGYGTIKYNASSPRFLNYASGQTDIQIYAKDDGLESRNLDFTANADTKDIKDGTSVSVLGLTGVTDGTRSYKSSDETVATITNDGAITLLSEGTTTISVSIAKNETYRAGSASYTLTVRDTRESCARPTASPDAGGVDKNTPVTLSCTTPNAKIYYRIGTTGDFTQYSSAITIDAAKTIYAYAEAPGYKRSNTVSFAYTINGGGTLAINFEGTISTSVWNVNNITSGETTITAHSGSKHGKIASASGYIQTKNKINNPSTFVCYVSKSTNNTTSSSWKVQYSANGTKWTDVKEQSATSMSKGTWVEINTNFPENLGEVYVRIYYSGSNAIRCIDDLVITY